MLNFQEFLLEKVNPKYLYHNTGEIGFKGIIDSGKIETPQSGFKYVSFSRSFDYHNSPGSRYSTAAKFIFDYDKLRQTHKIKPFADLSVVSNSKTGSFVGLGGKSRWESEELVKGPVRLDNRSGFIEVQLLKSVADKFEREIEIYKEPESYPTYNEQIEKSEKENLFWHQAAKEWRSIETLKQQRNFNVEALQKKKESFQAQRKKFIAQVEAYLNFPKLRIVTSFKRI